MGLCKNMEFQFVLSVVKWRNLLLAVGLSMFTCTVGTAQTPTRSPSDGIAVLDCAPLLPALKESCSLRIPPLHERGEMRKSNDLDAGQFVFIRANDPKFPSGLHLSATLILIDETPGPKGARKPFWPLERRLISELVSGLPKDELIAVYGFNEAGSLHALADYTVSKQLVRASVEAMQINGVNTHIASAVSDGIKMFSLRQDILFRNIIVITDGEEEGIPAVNEVRDLSIKSGVSVSAIGMFWRPDGGAEVGLAKDYLGRRLTTENFGIFESVPLKDPARATTLIKEFVARYTSSIEQSGLIVPDGEALTTEVIVETKVPSVGDPGKMTSVEHNVRFTPLAKPKPKVAEEKPAAPSNVAEPKTEVIDPDLLWGYPKFWYYYGAIGTAVLLLLLILIWIVRRGSGSSSEDLIPAIDLDKLADFDERSPAIDTVAAVHHARPLAVLIRDDTSEKLVIDSPGGTIGRAPSNTFVLLDDGVSRAHCEIRLSAGAIILADTGSLNGTFLNGKMLKKPAHLNNGDKIAIGNVTLRVTSI